MSSQATFQLPPQMSTFARDVDWTYYFIFWLSVVLLVGIIGAATYFAIKYRRRPGVAATPTKENHLLEAAWTIAPLFIIGFLFVQGARTYMNEATAPADAMQIRVRAFQWGWDFEYANGAHTDVLRVPVNKPVKLVLSSNDVIHSLFIPAFRIKKDAVPGMYTSVWFEATQEGETELFCAEYCGGKGEGASATGHWSMNTRVVVLSDADFAKFLQESIGPRKGETVEQWGDRLTKEKACRGCHSVDGLKLAGPSWKGIFGAQREQQDGSTVAADENYLRESMLEPKAKVAKGYAPIMPTFKGILQDKEIDAIISYMKTLQ